MIKEKEAQKKQSIDPAFFDNPQPEPFKWSKFLHNKKEGTYLGRSPNSWGKKRSGTNKFGHFFSLFVAFETDFE